LRSTVKKGQKPGWHRAGRRHEDRVSFHALKKTMAWPMTPAQFIAKWRANPLSERAGAQAFFLDLCAMLGVAPPDDPDNYCFERGATRTGAGHGWADV